MLKNIFSLILVFSVFQICVSSVSARTIYVSPNGTGNGSQSSPTNLNYANTNAAQGDTVILKNGTYTQQIKPSKSGTQSAPIIFQAENDKQAIIDGQGGNNSPPILLDNVTHIQIKDIKVDVGKKVMGTSTLVDVQKPRNITLMAVKFENGVEHVLLDNLELTNAYQGIFMDAFRARENGEKFIKHITVQNTEIHNTFLHCFKILGNIENIRIKHNNFHHCGNQFNSPSHPWKIHTFAFGIDIVPGHGFEVKDGPKYIYVENNQLHHNGVQGLRTSHSEYIYVANNYIHNNGATGYQVEHNTRNVVIEHNIFENNSQVFPFETGTWIGGSQNILYQHNIVRGNMMGVYVNGLKLGGSGSSDPVIPAERNIVRRNYIYSNQREPSGARNQDKPAFNALGIRATDLLQSAIYNNTLYNNGLTDESGHSDIFFSNTANNYTTQQTDVINNIVSQSNVARELGYHTNHTQNINSDYNLFFNTKRDLRFRWQSNQNLSFSAFKNTSGKESNSVTGNPKLVSPENDILQIEAGSEAINKGRPLAVTTNGGTNSTKVKVDKPYMFSDGFGLIEGDKIRVGSETAIIESINYETKELTLKQEISWSSGASVTECVVRDGQTDIGASELNGDESCNPTTPTIEPPECPKQAQGDLNCTGIIDILDYSALINNFGTTHETNSCLGKSAGDINCDGTVNISDFTILIQNFGS